MTNPLGEFDLIHTYFKSLTKSKKGVEYGIGDDAAILNIPAGYQLVTTVDTLVEGTHFLAETDPYNLGHKALAVNLSDIAAMGAIPKWFTLALSLPDINSSWLKAFSQGLGALANQYQVSLIGGDTTKGHKTLSIQLMGLVKEGQAVYRHGAKIDDDIYVSGFLGDASLALSQLLAGSSVNSRLLSALETPQPQINLGLVLKPYIHAMIDISDGLVADLKHICNASQCGATIYLNQLPLSPLFQQQPMQPKIDQFPLSGGEDYELCFTASKKHRPLIQQIAKQQNSPLTKIGVITKSLDFTIINRDGTLYSLKNKGYDHFNHH